MAAASDFKSRYRLEKAAKPEAVLTKSFVGDENFKKVSQLPNWRQHQPGYFEERDQVAAHRAVCDPCVRDIPLRILVRAGAILAILHDILMTMGIFFSGGELSSPVMAALLTIIGFSINDTIVIFDRIREDLKLGLPGTFTEIMNVAIVR